MTVAIVGGGVAGLATAHRLLAAEPALEVTVLESDPAVGGRLRTAVVGDLELEAGPDAFVARKPWAVELCRELGLELVAPSARGASVWTERGLVPLPETALGVPAGASELWGWAGLSRAGRVRALGDLVRRARRSSDDEALGALLRRRLGDEATERLVAPLLAGLFAGDVDRLGLEATFPELARWERDLGSLIVGARHALRASREAGPMFLKPVGGVGRLPGALREAIGPERIRLVTPVTEVRPLGPRFAVVAGDEEATTDAIVLATPADVTSRLISAAVPAAALALAEVPYANTAVVLLVYPEGTADGLPEETGFVVPRGLAPMTAATYLSRKWPDPGFGDRAVIRCFVGAVGFEDVVDEPDEDIVEAVARHLAAVLPLPERPEASHVVRWPGSMPQFEVGHLERVRRVEAALPPGIFVAGNAYLGVGVADAVRSGEQAAERVGAHLAGAPLGTERAT